MSLVCVFHNFVGSILLNLMNRDICILVISLPVYGRISLFEIPGSNPLSYRFEVLAFSFSPPSPSSLSCINKYLAIDSGGNVSECSSLVIAAWLECFPVKPSWCKNELVCHRVKCKVL